MSQEVQETVSPGPEAAVQAVYAEGAMRDLGLCCPVAYDPKLLAAIPAEVLERDYGCGDPTRFVRPGETVLDLGSGSGKSVFLLSQVVGAAGHVIGVDMNDAMLALARRAAPVFARTVGYDNVTFKKGRVQDLELDLEVVDAELARRPPRSAQDLARLEERLAELRRRAPLVADGAVDAVISDCVLNLVRTEDKARLFREIHRVLRRGGRAIISDIVSDEDVPLHLQRDPELWTGCISGAMREDRFLGAFEEAGLYGITVLERAVSPWRVVAGIEFRSITVAAYRGKEGPCWDRRQAVIYKGPFREVRDDDGHVLRRGLRVAVCAKTFDLYSRPPYREHFDFVEPRVPVPAGEERPFPCGAEMQIREPRVTKGEGYVATTEAAPACAPGGCCC